jgi:hypothetical protein
VIPTHYEKVGEEITAIIFMDSSGRHEKVSTEKFQGWWQGWSLDLVSLRMQLIKGIFRNLFWAEITDDSSLEGGSLIVPIFQGEY